MIGPENTCHFLNQSNSSLKTNHDLVVCVFPRFRHFDSSEFPLASCHFNHFLDWPLWFVLFWFSDTQSKSALLFTISTIFVNRIRKMVGFELGKETKKDGFFSSCHEWGQRKTNYLSPFLHRAQNSLSFFPYLQNMTLSTLLILAVCRTRVIYKLRDRSRSPWSLSGLVVQHRSADFVGFCSTLVKRREKSYSVSTIIAAHIGSGQIMGWGEKAIEVRSVETGLLDGVFMHKRAQTFRFLCERNEKVSLLLSSCHLSRNMVTLFVWRFVVTLYHCHFAVIVFIFHCRFSSLLGRVQVARFTSWR